MTESEKHELAALLDENFEAWQFLELLREMDDRARSLSEGQKIRDAIAPLIAEAEARDRNPRLDVLSKKAKQEAQDAFNAERDAYKPVIAKLRAKTTA